MSQAWASIGRVLLMHPNRIIIQEAGFLIEKRETKSQFHWRVPRFSESIIKLGTQYVKFRIYVKIERNAIWWVRINPMTSGERYVLYNCERHAFGTVQRSIRASHIIAVLKVTQSWKEFRLEAEFEHNLCDTSAVLYQLSWQTEDWALLGHNEILGALWTRRKVSP